MVPENIHTIPWEFPRGKLNWGVGFNPTILKVSMIQNWNFQGGCMFEGERGDIFWHNAIHLSMIGERLSAAGYVNYIGLQCMQMHKSLLTNLT